MSKPLSKLRFPQLRIDVPELIDNELLVTFPSSEVANWTWTEEWIWIEAGMDRRIEPKWLRISFISHIHVFVLFFYSFR